ncbi:MAG: hypothetical protein GY929_09485 [Actinomycetia bacterium]|nr:hypothetical protein [Actinomycetes bacterium]
MFLVRAAIWTALAALVGLLGGMVGWQVVGDDLAVPDLPSQPGDESIRAFSERVGEAPAVILTPIGANADGVVVPRGGHVDVVVEIRNPDSARYDQLAVTAELLDGHCSWPDGDLGSIWFLGARSSAERVCRLSLSGDDLGALTVVARNAGQEIGRARLVATVAAPEGIVAVEVVDGVPFGGPDEVAPAEPTGAACPGLGVAIEPPSSLLISDLGPLVTDRARLLDLDLCPEWSEAARLDFHSGDEAGVCGGWLVVSDGQTVGEIKPVESEQCDLGSGPLYLDIDADAAGPDLALQIVVLTGWALAGDRQMALAVAATLDRTARGSCDGGATLRARPPYLQDLPDGTTSYRAVLEAC